MTIFQIFTKDKIIDINALQKSKLYMLKKFK